jgi:ATP-dependent DNA helicase RecQ
MPKPRIRAAAKKAKARRKPVGDLEYDQNLFEKLRELRKEIAVEQGVPPFVVFSDASLAEMAAVRPQDDGGMLGITGVGKYKLEHYGARFLKVLWTPMTEASPEALVKQQ